MFEILAGWGFASRARRAQPDRPGRTGRFNAIPRAAGLVQTAREESLSAGEGTRRAHASGATSGLGCGVVRACGSAHPAFRE
jgi:hypothetical protein